MSVLPFDVKCITSRTFFVTMENIVFGDLFNLDQSLAAGRGITIFYWLTVFVPQAGSQT